MPSPARPPAPSTRIAVVPGPVQRKITVTGVRQISGPSGTQLLVGIRNDGNVLVKAVGKLLSKDQAGAERASVPLILDTILSGVTAEFSIAWPTGLPAGD